MRLFVAIEVPEAWREAARAARRALEGRVEAPLRWVDPALMHLTVRFIGEVEDALLGPLQRSLDAAVPPVDVEIRLDAAGTFGAPPRTSVVWLGVGGDRTAVAALAAVAARVEEAVVAAGLPPDPRPFNSHLTLARVGRGASAAQRRAVAAAVALIPAPPHERFRARSVALVRSHLGRGGPRYEVLSTHGGGAPERG